MSKTLCIQFYSLFAFDMCTVYISGSKHVCCFDFLLVAVYYIYKYIYNVLNSYACIHVIYLTGPQCSLDGPRRRSLLRKREIKRRGEPWHAARDMNVLRIGDHDDADVGMRGPYTYIYNMMPVYFI